MSQKSSLYRTIEILKELNEGKKLCVSYLALQYDVNKRTIQRDLKLINEIFGDFMTKEGECYQGHKKILLQELLHATDLMTLANIAKLFDITNKTSLISIKTDALIKNSMSVYDFKSRPFEVIKDKELLKKLEHAIKFKKEVILKYQGKYTIKEHIYHPYKIIFLSENFYVVGENIKTGYVESLRVSLIKELEYTSKNFYKHQNIENFIHDIQTPWTRFEAKKTVVKLYVYQEVAKYFILKKYLPTQKIAEKFDNGDIEIHYHITNIKELEELVIKWLPNIRIIEPKALADMVREVLLNKLNGLYKAKI